MIFQLLRIVACKSARLNYNNKWEYQMRIFRLCKCGNLQRFKIKIQKSNYFPKKKFLNKNYIFRIWKHFIILNIVFVVADVIKYVEVILIAFEGRLCFLRSKLKSV